MQQGNNKSRTPAKPQPTRADEPTQRELSQRQAMENAESARDTRRSDSPGIDDDSEVIQNSAAALAAPIEGAADAIREDERARVRSKSAAAGDDVAGPRAEDTPNVTAGAQRRDEPPSRKEDAEWDPLKATAEHRSDKRGK